MTARRLQAIFHVRSEPASVESRARAIATEQSVEMPLSAIDDPAILQDIAGTVEGIEDLGRGLFDVRIGLATETIGADAGQLLNMAFGNTSLHEDVVLHDLVLPDELEEAFGGPRHGLPGLRALVGATDRALTGSALKPQGLSPERLAELAGRFARGRVDFIKDDHGIADQPYSRFAERVPAIAASVRRTAQASGHPTRYVPSLSGNLDQMQRQVHLAREEGLAAVLIAPMIAGVSTLQALVGAWPEIAFLAHPTLAGAGRISPPLLIGKLFRLFGADGVIFPNFGGRFGYSPETCRRLAANATAANARLRASVPIPAGGMTIERVPEILEFYGTDAMLLLGGSLLEARGKLTEATLAFTEAVARYPGELAR
jgi:ribulose-bisphosphate carboxylase large chain